jgi:hypothetical protein
VKVCSKCKVEKDENEFHKDSLTKEGLVCWCKLCTSVYGKRYRELHSEENKQHQKEYREANKNSNKIIPEYKICNKCGANKKSDDFHKDITRKDGLTNYCKECRSLRFKEINEPHKKRPKIIGAAKICIKCGIEKEAKEFYKSKRAKDGRDNSCKECENKRKRKNKKTKIKIILTSKICSRCKIEKSIKEFYKNCYTQKDGTESLMSICKDCSSVINKERREKYPDKYKQYNKQRKNKPKIILKSKNCNKCGIEKDIKEFYKDCNTKDGYCTKCKVCKREYVWKPENRLRAKQTNKIWKKNNSEKIELYSLNRRTFGKQALTIPFTHEQWEQRMSMWGGRCAYCGCCFDEDHPMQKDHVIPLSKGGPHILANLRPACSRCNNSKGIKSLKEWFEWKKNVNS